MLSRGRDALLAAACVGAWTFPAAAQPQAASPLPAALQPYVSTGAFVSPSTVTYSQAAGVIDRVNVTRLNVFDPSVPGEDWWPFRIANRIHILTREPVVRRELLLAPGEPWDPVHALESERNLRFSGFIRKAEVRPSPSGRGKLDLNVLTQDSWTLAPQVNVGTEGGDRYFIWGVEESNLLGLGKGIGLFHGQVGRQVRNEARYRDPRLLGSRQRLTGLYARTEKGDELGALIDRPFYSLHSPLALQLLWARVIQEDILYAGGEERTKFLQNNRTVQASLGRRLGEDEDPVQRVLVGVHHTRDRFSSGPDTLAGTLPEDRELTGPVFGYSLIQPRFIKETFIDKMERVEDFNVGNEFSVSGGPMLKSWSSDRDRWLYALQDQQGWHFDEGRFLLGQAGALGRAAGGRFENALVYGNVNLFWKTLWPLPQTWVVHAEVNSGYRLDRERQLVLGGNTGLRGYKNNSFTGDKSMLLNLENRVFLTRELFHLFHLGGVAFFETGAVAPEGGGFRGSRAKSDVGFGLRAAPSRSTSGSVVRMDLAYALNDGPGPSRWVVSIRGGQAFQFFNSTNRTVLRTPAGVLGEETAGARLRRR